jgi:hypothetical protein
MEKHQVIRNIVLLPKKFYDDGNVSIYSLLKESGYFEFANQVSEANIFEILIQYPECISQWLSWSENKRSGPGWYFRKNETGKYIVGYFPAKASLATIEYPDITQACAVFIKRAIEEIKND